MHNSNLYGIHTANQYQYVCVCVASHLFLFMNISMYIYIAYMRQFIFVNVDLFYGHIKIKLCEPSISDMKLLRGA